MDTYSSFRCFKTLNEDEAQNQYNDVSILILKEENIALKKLFLKKKKKHNKFMYSYNSLMYAHLSWG